MPKQDLPLLIIKEGPLASKSWTIERDRILIGRGSDCDIILPKRQVSRHHACLERQSEGYVLTDLNSKNGTFVNGEQIDQPFLLQDGDEIQIALYATLSFVGAGETVPLNLGTSTLPVRIDPGTRRVWIEGQELKPPLSPAQYRLLELLEEADGQVVSRDDIVNAVWPDDVIDGVSEQAIDALVRRLRDRLSEISPDQQYIVTVRGHGFRLNNSE